MCQSSFTAFRAKARVAAFRLRPAGAIPAKTGSWNTGVGLRQPDMVCRELLIATSTFFTCGLLLQTGAQYSAGGEYQGLRGDPHCFGRGSPGCTSKTTDECDSGCNPFYHHVISVLSNTSHFYRFVIIVPSSRQHIPFNF